MTDRLKSIRIHQSDLSWKFPQRHLSSHQELSDKRDWKGRDAAIWWKIHLILLLLKKRWKFQVIKVKAPFLKFLHWKGKGWYATLKAFTFFSSFCPWRGFHTIWNKVLKYFSGYFMIVGILSHDALQGWKILRTISFLHFTNKVYALPFCQ